MNLYRRWLRNLRAPKPHNPYQDRRSLNDAAGGELNRRPLLREELAAWDAASDELEFGESEMIEKKIDDWLKRCRFERRLLSPTIGLIDELQDALLECREAVRLLRNSNEALKLISSINPAFHSTVSISDNDRFLDGEAAGGE